MGCIIGVWRRTASGNCWTGLTGMGGDPPIQRSASCQASETVS